MEKRIDVPIGCTLPEAPCAAAAALRSVAWPRFSAGNSSWVNGAARDNMPIIPEPSDELDTPVPAWLAYDEKRLLLGAAPELTDEWGATCDTSAGKSAMSRFVALDVVDAKPGWLPPMALALPKPRDGPALFEEGRLD